MGMLDWMFGKKVAYQDEEEILRHILRTTHAEARKHMRPVPVMTWTMPECGACAILTFASDSKVIGSILKLRDCYSGGLGQYALLTEQNLLSRKPPEKLGDCWLKLEDCMAHVEKLAKQDWDAKEYVEAGNKIHCMPIKESADGKS